MNNESAEITSCFYKHKEDNIRRCKEYYAKNKHLISLKKKLYYVENKVLFSIDLTYYYFLCDIYFLSEFYYNVTIFMASYSSNNSEIKIPLFITDRKMDSNISNIPVQNVMAKSNFKKSNPQNIQDLGPAPPPNFDVNIIP